MCMVIFAPVSSPIADVYIQILCEEMAVEGHVIKLQNLDFSIITKVHI